MATTIDPREWAASESAVDLIETVTVLLEPGRSIIADAAICLTTVRNGKKRPLEAINESLADSEQIAEVVSKIKDGGYDIFLVLEATIGVSKPGEKSSDKTSLVTTLTSNPEFKISEQDLKFLKSLRIKIEDDAA